MDKGMCHQILLYIVSIYAINVSSLLRLMIIDLLINFQVASIIFLDAPVGTGFSYSRTSQGYNITDKLSAAQTYEFLRKVSEMKNKFLWPPGQVLLWQLLYFYCNSMVLNPHLLKNIFFL